MLNVLSLICLFASVIPSSLANIFAYPISKKLSLKISDYIVKVLAPRVYRILHVYSKFNFWGYEESKKILPEKFLIISNHQSLLDIPTFMNFFPERDIRFVAKDVLSRHIPLVSEMLRVQQHCMVPRKAKPMVAMQVMDDFGKRTKERNQIPILFPEGTRSSDGNVGKFYSAGFRKLSESFDNPVVVFAIDGGYQLKDLKKICKNLKEGCYRIKALKTYPCPKTKEECNELLEEARILIQKQLDQWRALDSTVR